MSLRSYGHGIDVGREVIRQTVVSAEAALLLGSESVVEVVTEAAFVITPGEVGLTTMLIVTTSRGSIVPTLHVTVPLEWTHEP